jgi:diaminopimelate epimerase
VKIDFVKTTGAGNDFVLIDNRHGNHKFDWAMLAPKLCNRRYGIGADGILIVEHNPKVTFTMLYYNADGSYGGMCGNGGRCAALYVMISEHLHEVNFEALDHTYYCERISQESLRLRMKEPQDMRTNISIEVCGQKVTAHYIDTGAPHAVLFWDDMPRNLVEHIRIHGINEIGREVRRADLFGPDGTNVNFVTVLEESSIALRTYERGVEDETLACGTGSVAAAIISSVVRGVSPPVTVNTRSNEQLKVSFLLEGEKAGSVFLEGNAKILFTGQIVVE